jgi:putative membrane protein
MIRNFSDHAANERTFLAWVRTAIAVMAFGFLVERFDLFLEVAAPSLAGRTLSSASLRFGSIVGLALIIAGTAMIAIAAARFIGIAKAIDSPETRPGRGTPLDLALAVLLILLGGSLVLYLMHAVTTAPATSGTLH